MNGLRKLELKTSEDDRWTWRESTPEIGQRERDRWTEEERERESTHRRETGTKSKRTLERGRQRDKDRVPKKGSYIGQGETGRAQCTKEIQERDREGTRFRERMREMEHERERQ